MNGEHDRDLESRLRAERREARVEFVQDVSSRVQIRRSASASGRPRISLALALSLALLVSAIAFGGVGAASNALHSSADSLKAVVNKKPGPSIEKHTSPATKQYSPKVAICYPVWRWTIKYKWIEKEKWVWKKDGQGHKHRVKVTFPVKVRYKVKTITYVVKRVSAKQVARLVAKGAIYPVPAGGCPHISS
jgi:hypothetical protein